MGIGQRGSLQRTGGAVPVKGAGRGGIRRTAPRAPLPPGRHRQKKSIVVVQGKNDSVAEMTFSNTIGLHCRKKTGGICPVQKKSLGRWNEIAGHASIWIVGVFKAAIRTPVNIKFGCVFVDQGIDPPLAYRPAPNAPAETREVRPPTAFVIPLFRVARFFFPHRKFGWK